MRVRLAAATAALLIGAAAIAQNKQSDAPESLLPPGFGDPVAPAPQPTGAAPVSVAPDAPLPGAVPSPTPSPSASPSPEPFDLSQLAQFEMPAFARRSLDTVGPVGSSEGGLPPNAFGNADGRWLEALMRRTSAPLPSRWLSIALRRTLASRIDTPRGLNGADFAAERAWLLLRMGESVAARAVAQAVDTDRATPKLLQVTMQSALATGDPGGVCPLVPAALAHSPEPGWIMAQAMCAGLSGNAASATPLIAAARRKGVAGGIDFQLAQKVVGAGADSRQAVTIEWEPVTQLTAWRFGLATATGVTVPERLYATVGQQVTGWRALAPAIPLADRVAPATRAAAMGILSGAALVDFYSAADAAQDTPAPLAAVASDLRTAYVGADRDSRRDALRQLWDGGAPGADRYARLILTARAAARIPVASDYDDPDRLVAAMLSAGLDRTAGRWRNVVPEGGDAWATLLLTDPDRRTRVSYGDLANYAGSGDAARKQRLLFAGLAGLGRMAPGDIERAAQSLEVRIGAANAWTRALDRAAALGQPGTVVLLSAIGMQTGDWRGVPPEALYRIVTALRAVGLDGEARMIAAEAIARS